MRAKLAEKKETELNLGLNEMVREYTDNENYRSEILDRYAHELITIEVFYDTMRLIDCHKWTCLNLIDRRVSRMVRNDYLICNEVALQLYDELHGKHTQES